MRFGHAVIMASTMAWAGCPADGGGDPDGDEVPCTGACLTALHACRDVAAAACTYVYRCYSGAALLEVEAATGWTDELSCIDDIAGSACVEADLAAAFAEGRQALDEQDLDDCLYDLAVLECVDFAELGYRLELVASCEEIPTGLRQAGERCVEADDCAGLEGFCNADGVCESRGQSDYEIECDLPLPAGTCPGNVCMTFVDNVQGLTGTCTRRCLEDDDCGYGSLCVEVGSDHICFSLCLDDLDCASGLVCVVPDGQTVGICNVEAL